MFGYIWLADLCFDLNWFDDGFSQETAIYKAVLVPITILFLYAHLHIYSLRLPPPSYILLGSPPTSSCSLCICPLTCLCVCSPLIYSLCVSPQNCLDTCFWQEKYKCLLKIYNKIIKKTNVLKFFFFFNDKCFKFKSWGVAWLPLIPLFVLSLQTKYKRILLSPEERRTTNLCSKYDTMNIAI